MPFLPKPIQRPRPAEAGSAVRHRHAVAVGSGAGAGPAAERTGRDSHRHRRIDLALEVEDPDAQRLFALRWDLTEIESDAARIDVPLPYTDELYDLRLHIQLLEQKLERLNNQGSPA
jgi:hypothetical protein